MEVESFSAISKWPKIWRASRPPPALIIFQKLPDQNSEIAILFGIIKKSNNYVLGTTYSPTVPVGGAGSLKTWQLFTYSNDYWELYRRYQGGIFGLEGGGFREGKCGGNFPWRNFSWGKRISMKGAQDFLALKKWKKQIWKSFFNWK